MHVIMDKLRVKCERFREIESEMVKLVEVLDRHTVGHLFRLRHLKVNVNLPGGP